LDRRTVFKKSLLLQRRVPKDDMRAPVRRKKRSWTFVGWVNNMEHGKAAVKEFFDRGQNPKALWQVQPGGEAASRRMWKCTAHDGCQVTCRIVRLKTLEFALERALDEKHTKVVNEKDRKNASLSKKQKKECHYCMRYGGSPWDALRYEAYERYMAGAPVRKRRDGSCYVVGTPILLDDAP
jgi:hypothetical protein